MAENKHVAFDTELCSKNPEAAADRIAELEEDCSSMGQALKHVLSTLVATTSLIIRSEDKKCRPSKAVASDAMFHQMLKDYDAATQVGRAALSKASQS